MSIFTDRFATTAWTTLKASLGESVSYTAYGGNAATITGIWNPSSDTENQYDDSRHEILSGVLRVKPSDVTGIDDRAKFTIRGIVYAVKAITRNSATCEIELEARGERAFGEGQHRLER